jgi:N-acetylneuraminic acid mutarotase
MRRPFPYQSLLTLGAVALAACGENATPTQPEIGGDPAPAALSLAAASNTWTPTAAPPFTSAIYGYDIGMAPNSAGQSIVYTFGGTSEDEGGTGFGVAAYNVAANSWSWTTSRVGVFNSNGVGKIGSKLYFSGGRNDHEGSFSNQLWAYDYSSDRMIAKADLPIYSAEGVTGVINGKLYVLPGACSGEVIGTGYCATEPTRRFYRYDPTTNTWVQRRSAPNFHRQGAAAVLDGKFYVAGGFINQSSDPTATLDVYDPATNTWRTLAPLPTGGGANGAALGGQFYVVVHGFNGTTPVIRAYAYNPATNKWTAKAAPDVVGSIVRVSLDGRPRLFTATGNRSALYTP